MKKDVFIICLLLLSTILLVGCASLFNANPTLLNIITNPENATVIIRGLQNMEKITKKTPCTIYLNKSSDYVVTIKLARYRSEEIPIRRTITGWFWGNILLGGIIGMAIDYSTANMWEHQPSVINIDLSKITSLPDIIMIEFPITLLMKDGTKVVKNLPITFHRII